MKILQIGPPKCGNFWLYKILKEILNASGNNRPNFIEQQPIYELAKTWDLNYPEQSEIDMIDITDLQTRYRISSIYNQPILDIADYVSKTGHVWTHSPICKASEEVYNLFSHKVYIVRDPRDRAISAANYYCSPYMMKYFPQPESNPKKYLEHNFDKLMQTWVWHVFDHLKFSREFGIQILFYESFLEDFQSELSSLLEYLKIDLADSQKLNLEKDLSFTSMKEKNPKHLKKGTFGYWQDQLNTAQKERAEIIAGPLLKVLGYKELAEIGEFNPPTHFDFDFKKLKEDIIHSQKRM